MWAWDNDVREDARLAASLGFVFRHLPTTQDASIGIAEDGVTTFAFPARAAGPRRRCGSCTARVVSRLGADLRLVGARLRRHRRAERRRRDGSGDRLIHRYGVDARVAWGAMALAAYAKFNDWGPYDYHRDFNLTYPAAAHGRPVAHARHRRGWFAGPQTRLGRARHLALARRVLAALLPGRPRRRRRCDRARATAASGRSGPTCIVAI